jgi:hypothetical protein
MTIVGDLFTGTGDDKYLLLKWLSYLCFEFKKLSILVSLRSLR